MATDLGVAIWPSYPAGSNPSVGPNGGSLPPDSTLIGIDVGGLLEPVSAANPIPIAPVAGSEFDVNLNQVGGIPFALGQDTMAGSIGVVIASDQSTIPVADAAAEASLASILANQTNGTQETQVTNFPALQDVNLTEVGGSAVSLGQALSAASIPVVFASDQPQAPLPAVIYSGQQTSTGVAVAIAASTPLVEGVIVQALSLNVDSVYVGPAGVTSATGFELQPGQAMSYAVDNLDLIYVISVNSGDGVCYGGS